MRLETERLIVRPWRETDRTAYVQMMADPEVAYWLGGTLTAAQANAQVDRVLVEQDSVLSLMPIERRDDRAFLGACGLLRVSEKLPLSGEVEIAWRLARAAWGSGYATEAAHALVRHGLDDLGMKNIFAFTAETNLRSRSVMVRLGFERQAWRDFDHPGLTPDHPLRRHVVYALSRNA